MNANSEGILQGFSGIAGGRRVGKTAGMSIKTPISVRRIIAYGNRWTAKSGCLKVQNRLAGLQDSLFGASCKDFGGVPA